MCRESSEIEECTFYSQFCRVRRAFYPSRLHHIRNIDTATTTQKQEAQLPQRQRASNIVRCKRQRTYSFVLLYLLFECLWMCALLSPVFVCSFFFLLCFYGLCSWIKSDWLIDFDFDILNGLKKKEEKRKKVQRFCLKFKSWKLIKTA